MNSHTSRAGSFGRAPFLLMLTILCGCGRSGDVSGKVTFHGKPVFIGSVVILGSDSLPYISAIDEVGNYHIAKVPVGPARIALVSPDPRGPRPAAKASKIETSRIKHVPTKAAIAKWFPIPERFADPSTSGIALEIGPGTNEFDIVVSEPAASKK